MKLFVIFTVMLALLVLLYCVFVDEWTFRAKILLLPPFLWFVFAAILGAIRLRKMR